MHAISINRLFILLSCIIITENEINTFTRPLIPERRKEPKEQEVKPPINMALMTPSRGELDTKSQAPISSKKQVSWSDVLTPHRDQQTVVHNKVLSCST